MGGLGVALAHSFRIIDPSFKNPQSVRWGRSYQLFDLLLYLWVGDAVVCYRCGAVHSQFGPAPEIKPFDLGISERYRQQRIRREQLQAERREK